MYINYPIIKTILFCFIMQEGNTKRAKHILLFTHNLKQNACWLDYELSI